MSQLWGYQYGEQKAKSLLMFPIHCVSPNIHLALEAMHRSLMKISHLSKFHIFSLIAHFLNLSMHEHICHAMLLHTICNKHQFFNCRKMRLCKWRNTPKCIYCLWHYDSLFTMIILKYHCNLPVELIKISQM